MKKEINLDDFHNTLPFQFKDRSLLQKVFVHRSFLNEKACAFLVCQESNERLEFLGDAVLSNVISHMLFEEYPGTDEGELTRLRARLVNKQTLAGLAKNISLDEYLLLGKGERNSGGKENPTILAGVFEAFLAAVYIEFGFKAATEYIKSVFAPLIVSSLKDPVHFDFKPLLQELSQKIFKEAPVYKLIREDGPPHRRIFEVEVIVAGKILGAGAAAKKKDAEQAAAGEALKKLKAVHDEPAEDGRNA